MAYNTKAIKTDVDKKPIPQYYNPVTDEYDVLQGAAGAARHILYGADGNPISTSAGKLAVRASEIETLIGEVQAAPTPNTLLARLKNLETKVDAIIADGLKLSGSNVLIPKTKIINFINAESFAAYPGTGSSKYFVLPELDDCDELYLLLQVTKQPWYVSGSSPIMNCFGNRFTYPIYSESALCTKTYNGMYVRGMLFVLGGHILPDGASNPTNLDEAKKLAFPPKALSGKNMVFYNRASEENTVTIQLLEVWR